MEWTLPRAAQATGLSEAQIAKLAREFGTARPALIRAGIAIDELISLGTSELLGTFFEIQDAASELYDITVATVPPSRETSRATIL